jgi:hypothetical protein
MKTLVTLPCCLALLASSACVIDVDVDTDVDTRVRLEVDLTGECAGDGEIVADNGTTHWTKTLEDDGATCLVELDWDGMLVDTQYVRDEIEAEDVDIDDVEITSVEMRVVTAALADANGDSITPPSVRHFAAIIESVDQTLLDVEREDTAELVDQNLALEIPDAFVDEANRALQADETLRGTASATLRVSTSDLEALQAAPGPAGVQIDLLATVAATAEIRPLRR